MTGLPKDYDINGFLPKGSPPIISFPFVLLRPHNAAFFFPLPPKKIEKAGKRKKTIKKIENMANWCSNTVEFIGEHSQFEYLEILFEAMASKEKKEEKGQLPAFTHFDRGFLFDIRWEDGVLNYETKWVPNTEVLVAIADHFKVGFIYSYAEPGMSIFGETTYKDDILTDIFLDDDDTRQYEYDELADTYRFENQEYESSDEILDILLERKKAIKDLNNNEH
jgi:hypothetical protein